jgi:hypothetical protein
MPSLKMDAKKKEKAMSKFLTSIVLLSFIGGTCIAKEHKDQHKVRTSKTHTAEAKVKDRNVIINDIVHTNTNTISVNGQSVIPTTSPFLFAFKTNDDTVHIADGALVFFNHIGPLSGIGFTFNGIDNFVDTFTIITAGTYRFEFYVRASVQAVPSGPVRFQLTANGSPIFGSQYLSDEQTPVNTTLPVFGVRGTVLATLPANAQIQVVNVTGNEVIILPTGGPAGVTASIEIEKVG